MLPSSCPTVAHSVCKQSSASSKSPETIALKPKLRNNTLLGSRCDGIICITSPPTVQLCFCQMVVRLGAGLNSQLRALALDKVYHKDHDMMTGVGLRCWLDAVAECNYGAGNWFGTRCSSFVGLCRNGHGRSLSNGYWGHRKKSFVQAGNLMMVVADS